MERARTTCGAVRSAAAIVAFPRSAGPAAVVGLRARAPARGIHQQATCSGGVPRVFLELPLRAAPFRGAALCADSRAEPQSSSRLSHKRATCQLRTTVGTDV